MASLKRITTQYCENEDRFKLTGESTGGSLMCLWLSQRFLDRLIPYLLDWLETTATVNGKISPPQKNTIHNFEQHEALSQLSPENSKKTEPSDSSSTATNIHQWLVHEVDIRKSTEIMHLVFKNQQGNSAELLLKKIELRQWLFIICSQWEKSEWDRQIWPKWIFN